MPSANRRVVPSIVALLSLEMGIAVIVEAILSFVNLSISTDDPTWGGIIAAGQVYLGQAWWISLFPGAAVILSVLALNLVGDGLRDFLDPRLRYSA